MKTTNPTIKGYLPIRIALPPPVGGGGAKLDTNNTSSFTSFIYIKEHIQRTQDSSSSNSNSGGVGGDTLFIANAPCNGSVSTHLYLHALFELYGNIKRVTVAQDPRKTSLLGNDDDEEKSVEIFRDAALAGLDDGSLFAKYSSSSYYGSSRTIRGDGKFAHIVFTSSKEMKKALKLIKREISDVDDGDVFIMQLDEGRMEQLKTESQKLSNQTHKDVEDEDDDEEVTAANDLSKPTGLLAIAAKVREKAGRNISRSQLMQMCNNAMSMFEFHETELEQRAKLAAEQPDEDGFITVTHKKATFGTTDDLELEQHHRRKAGKRSRKRKVGGLTGADELSDFYIFQRKETRKKEVSDLKARFEEDLQKVKKMREERAYRPF